MLIACEMAFTMRERAQGARFSLSRNPFRIPETAALSYSQKVFIETLYQDIATHYHLNAVKLRSSASYGAVQPSTVKSDSRRFFLPHQNNTSFHRRHTAHVNFWGFCRLAGNQADHFLNHPCQCHVVGKTVDQQAGFSICGR